MLQAGVIGAGYGATILVPALRRAGIAVAAICSRSPEVASEVAERHAIPRWTADLSKLVADPDIELVCVASPPALHRDHVLAALREGKHVLCEKPMALDVAQAKEMYEAAEKSGLIHAIDHEFRFLPARKRVADLILSGQLGEVRMVDAVEHATRLHDVSTPERSWWLSREEGGGQLGALGSHWIDTLIWWLGPVAHVAAALATYVPVRPAYESAQMEVSADDSAALLLRFESGAMATLAVTAVATSASRRATIMAEEGCVRVIGNSEVRIDWGDGREEAHSYVSPPDEPGQPGQMAALIGLLHALQMSIAGEQAPAFPTFKDGLAVQSVLDRAYASQG